MHTNSSGIILGTLSTDESVPLTTEDRRRHVYVIGQTGTGKTGLLTHMMRADLDAGRGFCFLDPHGDAAQRVADAVPLARMKDVIYLDPSDATHTFAYNPLSGIAPEDRATATANIVSAFKNIWAQSWGPRLEYILTNALRLLLETKDQTLLGLPRLLIDRNFRHRLTKNCTDPVIQAFWRDEYDAYDQRFRNEAIAPIQNKIGVLLGNPYLRAILCQNASTLNIAEVMNSGKILIVNLSKGNLGTEPSHLLGALLITGFAQAAEGRRHMQEEHREDFTLVVDEFQNFATESLASILSEARKWRLALVAANQTIGQLPESLQQAVFGNAGTLIAFRVGARDATLLGDELGMQNRTALARTNNFQAWVRLMHNGVPMEPRLIKVPPPLPPGGRLARVISGTRARHMVPRAQVEARIKILLKKAPAKRGSGNAHRNPDALTA